MPDNRSEAISILLRNRVIAEGQYNQILSIHESNHTCRRFRHRISEESAIKPKPILWHIMKVYSHHDINDFVIRLGYKGNLIKEYFANCFPGRSDFRFALKTNNVEFLSNHVGPWIVTPTMKHSA
jgi:hypothetical protein